MSWLPLRESSSRESRENAQAHVKASRSRVSFRVACWRFLDVFLSCGSSGFVLKAVRKVSRAKAEPRAKKNPLNNWPRACSRLAPRAGVSREKHTKKTASYASYLSCAARPWLFTTSIKWRACLSANSCLTWNTEKKFWNILQERKLIYLIAKWKSKSFSHT